MPSSVKYVAILLATFGVAHFFFSLLEKGEYLPPWLTPLRGALILTFVVQLWMAMVFIKSGLPVEAQ